MGASEGRARNKSYQARNKSYIRPSVFVPLKVPKNVTQAVSELGADFRSGTMEGARVSSMKVKPRSGTALRGTGRAAESSSARALK